MRPSEGAAGLFALHSGSDTVTLRLNDFEAKPQREDDHSTIYQIQALSHPDNLVRRSAEVASRTRPIFFGVGLVMPSRSIAT